MRISYKWFKALRNLWKFWVYETSWWNRFSNWIVKCGVVKTFPFSVGACIHAIPCWIFVAIWHWYGFWMFRKTNSNFGPNCNYILTWNHCVNSNPLVNSPKPRVLSANIQKCEIGRVRPISVNIRMVHVFWAWAQTKLKWFENEPKGLINCLGFGWTNLKYGCELILVWALSVTGPRIISKRDFIWTYNMFILI